MKDFSFQMPARIVFGEGKALALGALCRRLLPEGEARVLLVTGPRVSKEPYFAEIVGALERDGLHVTVFSDTRPEPTVSSVDKAAQMVRQSGAKLLIAVGGGSPIDCAKAMAALATNDGSIRDYLFGGCKTVENAPLPLIAVPSTAGSGSEVTAASVIDDTERGVKLSLTHESLIPRFAVVDPLLQRGMPPAVTAATGMDALTHAVEAYVSVNASPVSDAYAEKCIELIGTHLRTAVGNGADCASRGGMAVAAVLGAAAFLNAGLGAVHGVSQSIGGAAHTSHGATNAVMLPVVMARNLPGSLAKFARIAALLGERTEGLSERDAAEKAVQAVKTLSADIGIPKRLSDLGVRRDMFDEIVRGTMGYRLLAVNPVRITEQDVYDFLEKAI